MQMHFFFAFFCITRSQWFFAYFAFFLHFFCICFAFRFLLMSQSMDKFVSCGVANDAAADVDDTPKLIDGEGDSEPDLEEPEEPEKKKVKLNYGAKATPASRARQYLSGIFEVRGDCMWCCVCQKAVCHTRKNTADQQLARPSCNTSGFSLFGICNRGVGAAVVVYVCCLRLSQFLMAIRIDLKAPPLPPVPMNRHCLTAEPRGGFCAHFPHKIRPPKLGLVVVHDRGQPRAAENFFPAYCARACAPSLFPHLTTLTNEHQRSESQLSGL